MSAARLATWERRAERPLLVLAVAYLVSYAITVLATTLSPVHRTLLGTVTATLARWPHRLASRVAELESAPR